MDKKGEILLYKTEDGKSQLDVRLEDETFWLNQKQIAELFDKDYKPFPNTLSIFLRG